MTFDKRVHLIFQKCFNYYVEYQKEYSPNDFIFYTKLEKLSYFSIENRTETDVLSVVICIFMLSEASVHMSIHVLIIDIESTLYY